MKRKKNGAKERGSRMGLRGREGKQESELQKGFKREEKGGQGRGGYRKGKERLKGKE